MGVGVNVDAVPHKITPFANFENSNFQQLAKDKKLNTLQWEVHLIEFKFCENTSRPDLQLQKTKAQHSVLIANLDRRIQGSQASRDPRWSYGDYLQRLYRQTSGRP